MWKVSSLVVLVAQLSLVLCYKKPYVEQEPAPMEGFVPEQAAGRWYTTARFIPCKFQGSRLFTNIATDFKYVPGGDRRYHTTHTFRKAGRCSNMVEQRSIDKKVCAKQFTRDPYGGMNSGKRVIVCCDYHKYMIEWGCLNYSQSRANVCDDITMTVYTRKPVPSEKTLGAINSFLKDRFTMELNDLDRTTHTNPC